VKHQVSALISLGSHTCEEDPLQLYLLNKALAFGKTIRGCLVGPSFVERIVILLADPAWGKDDAGTQALAKLPEQASATEQPTATLTTPSPSPLKYCSGSVITFCVAQRHHAALSSRTTKTADLRQNALKQIGGERSPSALPWTLPATLTPVLLHPTTVETAGVRWCQNDPIAATKLSSWLSRRSARLRCAVEVRRYVERQTVTRSCAWSRQG
jgi:hypothetical protein